MKRKGKETVSKRINKTAWILQYPNLGAGELVAKAKAKGIELSEKYVYNIRAKAKAAASNGNRPRAPGRPRKGASAEGIEQQFLELALAVGITRAESLLTRARAAVRSVLEP